MALLGNGPAEEPRGGRGGLVALAALAVLLTVSGFVVYRFYQSQDRPSTRDPASDGPAPLAGVSLAKPAPRDQGYVGSEACRECHEELYQKYVQSPMGQSLATVADAHRLEGDEDAVIDPPGPRRYHVHWDDETLVHAERMEDEAGEPIYEQREEVDYIVGSGRRGRAYLLHEADGLYQSPLGWYSQNDQWDLSPGYDPQNHPRFSRRIGDGCLYCHAGRTNSQGSTAERFGDPVFFEAAIGCERCHGPGEAHVQYHRDGPDNSLATELAPQDPIVNPIHLDPERRDNVCNQCHLMGESVTVRYGRGFFDFRPGDRIEDVFVILESVAGSFEGATVKAVSQVEQMQSSECYKASDGALSCVSCHDPHSPPPEAGKDEFYRNRCFECHDQDGCAKPLPEREAAPAHNSCVHCHMPALPAEKVPHTSLTHHGIPRFKDARNRPLVSVNAKGYDEPGAADQMQVFGDGEKHLPQAEVDRAKGVALMSAAWQSRGRELAEEARMLLLNVLQYVESPLEEQLAVVDDVLLLNELASSYFLTEEYEMARICWQRVVQLEEKNETALLGLAKLAEQERDVPAVQRYLDQLREVDPRSQELWSMRMKVAVLAGDTPQAIEAGERLLELNPTLVEYRQILASAYRRAGRAEDAEEQEKLIERTARALESAP